jgi:hypothetical protein
MTSADTAAASKVTVTRERRPFSLKRRNHKMRGQRR